MATESNNNGPSPEWFKKQEVHGEIPESSTRLLESYSKIPAGQVTQHIIKLRDEAWEIYPYPCIGQFRFLESGLTKLPEYKEVLERISQGQKFLDVGCCFGQTVRQLVSDGAPAENIYASDLEDGFIKLGYKLFRDEDKLQAKFLVADIFEPTSALSDLNGKMDIVFAGSFFHLWGLEKQKKASKLVAALLRPQPGSLLLGRQVGAEVAEEVHSQRSAAEKGTMYRHNPESFKKLWKEIGDELGVSFKVEATMRPLPESHPLKDTYTKIIFFSVRRE